MQDVAGANAAAVLDRATAVLALVASEWRAGSSAASPALLTDMFAGGPTGPDKQERALRWLGAAVSAPETAVAAASSADLLLKFAAAILMDPRYVVARSVCVGAPHRIPPAPPPSPAQRQAQPRRGRSGRRRGARAKRRRRCRAGRAPGTL